MSDTSRVYPKAVVDGSEETVTPNPNFPDMEEKVLNYWDKDDTFQKSIDERPSGDHSGNEFVFFDGPPFANGLPHYGHLLAGTIKDIIPRYQTMRGKYVERRFGWDTHGLPIEALAQKALGIDGAAGIRDFGVDKFNEQCRSMVLRYVSEWRETVTRMGRWVDFDHDYKTMEPTFMETVWWVFKQIFDQGRVYRSRRSCRTAPRTARRCRRTSCAWTPTSTRTVRTCRSPSP